MTRRAASKPADGGKAKAAKIAHAAGGAANTNINVEHMAEVGAAWEDIMMCLAFSAFFVWVLSQDTSARIEKIRKVSSYSKNKNDIIMKHHETKNFKCLPSAPEAWPVPWLGQSTATWPQEWRHGGSHRLCCDEAENAAGWGICLWHQRCMGLMVMDHHTSNSC